MVAVSYATQVFQRSACPNCLTRGGGALLGQSLLELLCAGFQLLLEAAVDGQLPDLLETGQARCSSNLAAQHHLASQHHEKDRSRFSLELNATSALACHREKGIAPPEQHCHTWQATSAAHRSDPARRPPAHLCRRFLEGQRLGSCALVANMKVTESPYLISVSPAQV